MNRDYLEWLNKSYEILIKNVDVPKMELKTIDGKLSVYRVVDVIRFDIKLTETKKEVI